MWFHDRNLNIPRDGIYKYDLYIIACFMLKTTLAQIQLYSWIQDRNTCIFLHIQHYMLPSVLYMIHINIIYIYIIYYSIETHDLTSAPSRSYKAMYRRHMITDAFSEKHPDTAPRTRRTLYIYPDRRQSHNIYINAMEIISGKCFCCASFDFP